MTTATIATKRRTITTTKINPAKAGARSVPLLKINTSALTRSDANAVSDAKKNHLRNGTKYASDADMQAVLDAYTAITVKAIETLEPVQARKQPTPADAVKLILRKQGKDWSPATLIPGVMNFEATIAGPARELSVRIYMPSGTGPFPVVVYFHGGGWVLADKNVYDGAARGIAKSVDAVVVSVDYRLAPEAKFPAQYDDALAAYKWVSDNAASVNGDPKRLAIAGESAGGTLAIATAIAARDQHLTAPLHVLAIYPIAQAMDMSTPSYQDCENARPLNKAMMKWFATHVYSRTDDKTDPRIDLVNAKLKGLPPITLINARIDPLRSDSDLLANALKNAGVSVEHKVYEGVTHEFFGMTAVVAKAREAQAYAGRRLKASLT